MGKQNNPRKYQERKLDVKSDVLYPAENAAIDGLTSWVIRFTNRKVTAGLDFVEKKVTEFINAVKHNELKALQNDDRQQKKSKGSR